MKLFVVGVPCSGKSTVAACLREEFGLNAVDVDDQILRLNQGVWPSDLETKNEVLLPKVLNEALEIDEVILFNSYLFPSHAALLREAGFRILLLEVPEAEIRRRDAVRFKEEGWTNIEWLDWHRSVIGELRADGFIDDVIAGNRAVGAVAEAISDYVDRLA